MPFTYFVDQYRYAIFRNQNQCDWNCMFWIMRSKLTGVEPPIYRNGTDFDPPAKNHFSSNSEYMRYFTAHIFEFQFHKALCKIANQYDPKDPEKQLDNCDIYNNKAAGAALR